MSNERSSSPEIECEPLYHKIKLPWPAPMAAWPLPGEPDAYKVVDQTGHVIIQRATELEAQRLASVLTGFAVVAEAVKRTEQACDLFEANSEHATKLWELAIAVAREPPSDMQRRAFDLVAEIKTGPRDCVADLRAKITKLEQELAEARGCTSSAPRP